jgi:hypothetical protein
LRFCIFTKLASPQCEDSVLVGPIGTFGRIPSAPVRDWPRVFFDGTYLVRVGLTITAVF